MIFRALKIEGFGVHRDLELGDLAPGLNVVFGENEAGKTTLLQFVRAVLFGFEERKASAQRYEPLAGGRHGGSISIDVGGERLRLSRFFRPGKTVAGEPAAEDAQGAPIDAEAARRKALGNASRVLFENVFSLRLEDLARFPSLDADGLREHVYGAATTGSGVSLPSVLESLRKRSRDLLSQAGKSGRVVKLLDEIARLRMEAGALAERPAEHARLVERMGEVFARIEALEASLPAKEAARRIAERLSRASEVHAALASLPERSADRPKFPAGGVERLKECQEALSRARNAAQRAGTRRDELSGKVKQARWDARLVELGSEIDAVFGESDRRIGNDAPGQALVKAQKAAERARALRDSLGRDGADGRLESFDASPASERELIGILDRRADAERTVREARRDVDVAADAERRDTDEAARLAGEIERIGDAADRAAKLEKRVVEFERTLDEERSATAVWVDIQRRAALAGSRPEARVVDAIAREQNRPLYFVAALAATAGATMVFFGYGVPGALVFVAALALVAYAIYRLPVAVPFAGPGTRETEEARAALERLRGSLKDRSILAFGRPDARAEDAHRSRDEIGRLKALAQRRQEVERLLGELKADAATSARVALDKRQVADAAEKVLDQMEAAFRAWLASHGFAPATAPDAARSSLLAIREAQAADAELSEARAEVARLEKAAKEFAERVEALGARLDRPGIGRGSGAAIHVALTALHDDSLQARAVKAALGRDAADLATAEEEAKAAAAEVKEADKRLQALLAEAAAFDVEVFHARAKAAEAWQRAEDERLALEAKLRAALGDEVPAEARERLAKATPEELARDVREQGAAIDALQKERDGLLQEHARLEAERKRMESEEALSQVRLAEEGRAEELAAAAEQWHVLAAAEWLVDSARRRFEEEHQPAILREASRLLEIMTAGRWTRVAADRETPDDPLRVTRFDGETLPVSALSRGTVEQLYLCLRLALAADFPDPGVRLPVLLDDVLVNFSGARRAGAARAIADVAERVQVIAFTCHPELRDALIGAAPRAHRIDLPEPSAPAPRVTLARG